MEFVHSLKKSDINETDLYNQNTVTDDNCYFENRLTKPLSNVYIPTTNVKDSYSNNYSSNINTQNLESTSEIIPNNMIGDITLG